jgi:hypothetical protein
VIEYGKARPHDVALVRTLLEEGRELQKTDVAKRWHIPDRRFRAAVAALRIVGVPVVSFSEAGSTYRLAKDVDELEHFINEIRSRRAELDAIVRALSTPEARKRIPRTQLDLAM